MERLDQDRSQPAAHGHGALEQDIDELIWELTYEVSLPVVALDAVCVPVEILLCPEVMLSDIVVDEPRHCTERPQRIGIVARSGVARGKDEARRARLVQPQDCLAAQVVRRSGHEVT